MSDGRLVALRFYINQLVADGFDSQRGKLGLLDEFMNDFDQLEKEFINGTEAPGGCDQRPVESGPAGSKEEGCGHQS